MPWTTPRRTASLSGMNMRGRAWLARMHGQLLRDFPPVSRYGNPRPMLMAYATVAVFVLVAVAFVLGSMLFGKLLRPNHPDGQKLEVYECGEAPETQAWFNFNPRF